MSRQLRVVVGVNAIVLAKGRILVLRRSVRSPNYAGRWDLPGGLVEPGETLEVALRRELSEETGLATRIHRPLAAAIVPVSPTRGGLCVTYLCGIDAQRTPKLAPTEHDRFRWVTPEVALRLRLRPPQPRAIQSILDQRRDHRQGEMLAVHSGAPGAPRESTSTATGAGTSERPTVRTE